jgi:fructose/tagatose bisphosphate aldolase
MAGRAVIVHTLDQARAAAAVAAELGVPVTLASAPGAAGYLGALWFREMLAMVRAEHPKAEIVEILDCGDQPGAVMAALRQGLKTLRFTGPKAKAEVLAELAQQYGARLVTGRLAARDLVDEADPAAACRAWLRPV